MTTTANPGWFDADPRYGTVYAYPLMRSIRTASADDLAQFLCGSMDAWVEPDGTTVTVDDYDHADPILDAVRAVSEASTTPEIQQAMQVWMDLARQHA